MDLIIYSVPILFAASKNQTSRNAATEKALVVAETFTEAGVATCDLIARYHADPTLFEVRQSDLLPDGDGFSRIAFHQMFQHWLGKIKRWKTPQTTENLKESLKEEINNGLTNGCSLAAHGPVES
jgi:hypothetical protein